MVLEDVSAEYVIHVGSHYGDRPVAAEEDEIALVVKCDHVASNKLRALRKEGREQATHLEQVNEGTHHHIVHT